MPLAILFFPIVKRFAVDLVNRRLGDCHCAWLPSQEKVNVVGLSLRPFHVHTSEVFPAAKIGESIVMHSDQIESQILILVFHMKLAVTALFGFRIDIFLDAGGNIRLADLFFCPAFFRVFWMSRMLCSRAS